MTQLLQVLHNVCRFYLDFVKAFDRFHNKLLLKKLHRFGICSCPVDLVRRLSHWPRPKGHRSRSQRPASPCVIRRAARINTWTSLVPHICDWMTFRWRGDLCFSLCRWQEVLLANEKPGGWCLPTTWPRTHQRMMWFLPGGVGGGVLWEFLGGDVQLGPWNP